jgi:murein tripeptide amidase MpaA
MSRLLVTLLLSSSSRSVTAFSPTRPSSSGRVVARSLFRSLSMLVSISDTFDGGNIEFIGEETTEDDDTALVRLKIKKDPYTLVEDTQHFQSFCFRSLCSSDDRKKVKYVIENAGETSYAKAWEESTVFYSPTLNDPDNWMRLLDTEFKDGKLTWTCEGSGYFSYFPPYSYNRHLDLIAKCGDNVSSLGKSLDGRELECVTLGTGDKKCWIIHRQHPGESMAEYFAEGLLERLMGVNGSVDGLVARLLQQYTFHIVPNMCPDGSVRGHLRTNAGGQNLNREWAPSENYDAPTLERSPEVYHVLNKMQETGVDAFLDIHGDEVLPFNFFAGSEGLPNWSPRLEALHGAFVASYGRANSDMQNMHGYDPEPPTKGRTNVCSNQIGLRFDCFAGTLEMPFKDCLTNPDPERGWSPARSKQLGASSLDALEYIYPYLRDETEFWTALPDEDAYLCPTEKYK